MLLSVQKDKSASIESSNAAFLRRIQQIKLLKIMRQYSQNARDDTNRAIKMNNDHRRISSMKLVLDYLYQDLETALHENMGIIESTQRAYRELDHLNEDQIAILQQIFSYMEQYLSKATKNISLDKREVEIIFSDSEKANILEWLDECLPDHIGAIQAEIIELYKSQLYVYTICMAIKANNNRN